MIHAAMIALLLAQPELRPIDEGTEDLSVNSESRLIPRLEQRLPAGFEQLYELTKIDGERVFVRMSGGVYAEFDRSVYGQGGNPLIPPGTVFHIGSPTAGELDTITAAPNRVSLAAGQSGAEPARAGSASLVGDPSIIGNELYRRVRISQLLFGLLKPEASEP